jgi:hypothetical protein
MDRFIVESHASFLAPPRSRKANRHLPPGIFSLVTGDDATNRAEANDLTVPNLSSQETVDAAYRLQPVSAGHRLVEKWVFDPFQPRIIISRRIRSDQTGDRAGSFHRPPRGLVALFTSGSAL